MKVNRRELTEDFRLVKLLSNSELTESWLSVNLHSGDKAFLKLPSSSASLPKKNLDRILKDSYFYQQKLSPKGLNLARTLKLYGSTPVIEYPLLDGHTWLPADQALTLGNICETVRRICFVVENLHLQGVIHVDLKVENFLFKVAERECTPILIDLDCLHRIGDKLNENMLGTLEFIPPEQKRGENLGADSDYYSLGASIRAFVSNHFSDTATLSPAEKLELEKLSALCENLTQHNRFERPGSLIKALLDVELITPQQNESLNRKLFRLAVARHYQTDKSNSFATGKMILFSPKNLVHGIPEETRHDLADALRTAPMRAIRAMLSLINNSELHRYGSFWHIVCDVEGFHALYTQLQSQPKELLDCPTPTSDLAFARQMRAAIRLSVNHHPVKSAVLLFSLKNLAESDTQLLSPKTKVNYALYYSAALSALTKNEDALATLQRLNSELHAVPKLAPRVYERMTAICVQVNLFDKGLGYAEAGLEFCGEFALGNLSAKLERFRAWILSSLGKHDLAEDSLDKLEHYANKMHLQQLAWDLQYDRSVIHWRKGEQHKAIALLVELSQCSIASRNPSDTFSTLTMLSIVYFEVAEYSQALDCADRALKLASASRVRLRRHHALQCQVNPLIRAGQYQIADASLHEFIDSGIQTPRANAYSEYFQIKAWLCLTKGDIAGAETHIMMAKRIAGEASENPRVLARIYYTLADINFHRGNLSEFSLAHSSALSAFGQYDDLFTIAECNLLPPLNDYYNKSKDSRVQLLESVRDLLRQGAWHHCIRGALHLALIGSADDVQQVYELLRPETQKIATSQNPLFRAFSALTDIGSATNLPYPYSPPRLREVYSILNSSGFYLLACQTAIRIGEEYQSCGRRRLATPYLQRALHLAETIRNIHLKERIESLMDSKPNDDAVLNELKSMESISKILAEPGNTETALTDLLNEAIELVGAERGAILCRTHDGQRLKVESYSECDPEDLTDICSLSMSIAESVALSGRVWRVDDATTNKSTKTYKSVARFNVLSVLCLPFTLSDGSSGILYFDNHTIPAFFSNIDEKYASIIANLIASAMSNIRSFNDLKSSYDEAKQALISAGIDVDFISKDQSMLDLLSHLQRAALHDVSILLTGETGTGKDVLASWIHQSSNRKDRPFVKLNCAAIPEDNALVELFGAKKGAYTGVGDVIGKLASADGGTLFMDEIGDLPLSAQAKLLHAVESNEFQRLGDARRHFVDIRYVFATNKDLGAMVASGSFRQDLYYRISPIVAHTPPLRDRPDDIPLLVEHFMRTFSQEESNNLSFSPGAMRLLRVYIWPGNVRELRNLIERICIFQESSTITASDLPEKLRDPNFQITPVNSKDSDLDREMTLSLLEKYDWNVSTVAEIVGVSLATMYRRLSDLGIKKKNDRQS